VVCIAVNDPFVMEEWAKSQESDNIFMLPDGNGAFTEQMGMLVDKSDLNFGKRSWRYSMLVRDGIVEKMFVEPEEPGDPFKVSDADTLLHYVNKDAHEPDQVALLTREGCAFCAKAKKLLDEAGVTYADVPLPHSIRTRALGAIAKATTVPQMFVNGELIGGSDAVEPRVARRPAGVAPRTRPGYEARAQPLAPWNRRGRSANPPDIRGRRHRRCRLWNDSLDVMPKPFCRSSSRSMYRLNCARSSGTDSPSQ
jgi:glutaredoxin-like protein